MVSISRKCGPFNSISTPLTSSREKALRGHFKKWGIDDKYKRKHREGPLLSIELPGVATSEANTLAPTIRNSGRYVNKTQRIGQECTSVANPIFGRDHRHNDVRQQDSGKNFLKYMPDPERDRQSQRILAAVGKWYSALFQFQWEGQPDLSMDCPMMELSNDIHLALVTTQRSNSAAGWSTLREAGAKAHIALKCRHPGTVPELILLLSHLQTIQRQDATVQPTVMAIWSLLQHLCCHLDRRHPVRLLATAFLSEQIAPDIFGLLFKVIEHNFTSKLAQSRQDYVRSRLKLTFGWIYHTQQRYDEVNDLLAGVVGEQKSTASDPYQEVEAYRILAKSRTKIGRLPEANELLMKAWSVLDIAGLQSSQTAHHLLLDGVQAKWMMGDLGAAEHLLHKVLRIAERQRAANGTDISYVLYLLRDIYMRQGKKAEAISLAHDYPDFFG